MNNYCSGKNRLYNLTNLAVQPATDKLIESPFRWKRVCKCARPILNCLSDATNPRTPHLLNNARLGIISFDEATLPRKGTSCAEESTTRNRVWNWVVFADLQRFVLTNSSRSEYSKIESKEFGVIRSLEFCFDVSFFIFPRWKNFLVGCEIVVSLEHDTWRMCIVTRIFRYRFIEIVSLFYTDNQCSSVQRVRSESDFSIYASPRVRPKYGKMLPRVFFFSEISRNEVDTLYKAHVASYKSIRIELKLINSTFLKIRS